MLHNSRVTKVPWETAKIRPEKYLQDLSKLEKIQLLEIKEREEKLLSKQSQLLKLPDKGERIKNFYEKVVLELSKRDEIERAAEMFSDLNIASEGKAQLNNLEWTGKCEGDQLVPVVDSDDEDSDPLAIIAQSRQTEKIVKYVKLEQSLVTEEDLKEIKSFLDKEVTVIPDSKHFVSVPSSTLSKSFELEPHSLYLMDKSIDTPPAREKFKPYKTTKSDVHNPVTEKLRKQRNNWENTAATPPLIHNSASKMLSLQDSVELQVEYLANLKYLQEKNAEERLAAKQARLCPITLPDKDVREASESFKTYRESIPDEIHSRIEGKPIDSDDDEEDGVRDDEDEKGAGVVNFTVYE